MIVLSEINVFKNTFLFDIENWWNYTNISDSHINWRDEIEATIIYKVIHQKHNCT